MKSEKDDDRPPQLQTGQARRVSVAVRHEVMGELLPSRGGRRVTLSLREETMDDIRSTLQNSMLGQAAASMQSPGVGDSADLHKLPPVGGPRGSPGSHTPLETGTSEVALPERDLTSADLHHLHQALRNMIPTGAQPLPGPTKSGNRSGTTTNNGSSSSSKSQGSSKLSALPESPKGTRGAGAKTLGPSNLRKELAACSALERHNQLREEIAARSIVVPETEHPRVVGTMRKPTQQVCRVSPRMCP